MFPGSSTVEHSAVNREIQITELVSLASVNSFPASPFSLFLVPNMSPVINLELPASDPIRNEKRACGHRAGSPRIDHFVGTATMFIRRRSRAPLGQILPYSLGSAMHQIRGVPTT